MSLSKHNWQSFFDEHAPHYMENVFTANTMAEVDFLIEEMELAEGSRILDIGCGTGRHSIELAKRGYKVTGVDLSEGMLAEARKTAAEANVEVEWIHCDAVTYNPTQQFDAAICLCEGAFGLIGRDEEPVERDTAIVANISNALKPKGRFILTTLNAYAKIRSLTQENIESGRFNLETMVEHYWDELDVPGGKLRVEIKERRYFPFELKQMFAKTGMTVQQIWGGTAGNWRRESFHLDEIEMMLTARKE